MNEANTLPVLATVTAIVGDGVRLRLEGEADAGQKTYRRLASYTPAVGDRVYLARVSGTFLVIGAIA